MQVWASKTLARRTQRAGYPRDIEVTDEVSSGDVSGRDTQQDRHEHSHGGSRVVTFGSFNLNVHTTLSDIGRIATISQRNKVYAVSFNFLASTRFF